MLRGFRSLLVVVPVVGALIGAVVVPSAQAAPEPGVSTDGVHSPVNKANTAALASTYWTKERMLSAKPVPVPKVDAATNAQWSAPTEKPGRAGKVAGAAPKAGFAAGPLLVDPGATAASWAGAFNTPPAITSGKVFFTGAGGAPFVCSGGTINSGGKNLVFTAGHCVSNGAGGWYNSAPWIYVPSYNNGNAPFGQWTARQLWTRPAWHNGGNRAEDIGAAVMFTNGAGTRIVDAVGGQGIEWNYPLSQYQFQFGYPTRAPFNGQVLKYCTGTSYNDGGHNGINCNMTEGASGGPWLDDFNGTWGWLDSVNSWVFWNGAGVRFKWNGPYFGNNARDFYNTIANL